jgi:starvation-inducible outer membrane lipoprotein
MEISESRTNNGYAIASVEKWLDLDSGSLEKYYVELINDKQLLATISDTIVENKNYKEELPGLFNRAPIENVDWYGLQRILIYCFVRQLKPELVLETGVYYGGNSVFVLGALQKNKKGKLMAIDYPQNRMNEVALGLRHPWVGETEVYTEKYQPGFIIPELLRDRFELVIGDSLTVLPTISSKVDFFIHDSEHTLLHVLAELNLVWDKLSDEGIAFVDDIDWSNGFYSFTTTNNLYPLLLTDNGKDNLRIRTGLIKKSHRFNNLLGVTR